MKKKEQELFKSLCSFRDAFPDASLLEAATPTVLGQLHYNRMQAIAYGTLKKYGLLGMVNREFKNSLYNSYIQNLEKNYSYFHCLKELNEILSGTTANYAMLKGARLCLLYPEAYRTANDVDLLVLPEHVSVIGTLLQNAGFKQGNVRNGQFVPASRHEIIASKMMRGETVPYIKEVSLPGMPFCEVDINFSFDYKPDQTETVSQMLEKTVATEINGIPVMTLCDNDFFVHLCCHLYKEATTLPWIEMKRDMTMYKYCDIYLLLHDVSRSRIDDVFKRAFELGLEKVCAFAILQAGALFPFNNTYARLLSEQILQSDPEFLHRVVSPKNGESYIYKERDIQKRFWSANRKNLLKKEV